jgi:hypothetical protein
MAPRLKKKSYWPLGPRKDPRCTFSFLSKVPANEPPPGSPTGPLWGERFVYRAPCISLKDLIRSFITVGVPIKEPSHEKRGNIWSLSTEHHVDGRLTYNGVRPGSPRGSFTTLQFSTSVLCSLQHDTFHLGLGRPEPS